MKDSQSETVSTLILGAGVTGLAAGIATDGVVLERSAYPGGICSSYYCSPPDTSDPGRYRFEYGGGHWVFGGEPDILDWMEARSPTRTYQRHSAVYFPDQDRYVPYPLQNHLFHLGPRIADTVLEELRAPHRTEIVETLSDWLLESFGPTLCELFFSPFHDAYTAGLFTRIAPQDAAKSPIDLARVEEGARGISLQVGYNVAFRYPESGLNHLVASMASDCDLRAHREVTAIRPEFKEVDAGGDTYHYQRLISTLPLDRTLDLAGIEMDVVADPHTAVLVLNIGAIAGPRCPDHHWLYIPRSRSGFHRVGFYSNVDPSFVPSSQTQRRTSIYVERAYLPGQSPDADELARYQWAVIEELRAWGYITDVEVLDPTWVEMAYTWAWPDSTWREKAISALQEAGIEAIGRYAQWHFQGIADSIRDGLGAAIPSDF